MLGDKSRNDGTQPQKPACDPGQKEPDRTQFKSRRKKINNHQSNVNQKNPRAPGTKNTSENDCQTIWRKRNADTTYCQR